MYMKAVYPTHDESHILYFLVSFLIIVTYTPMFCYPPILNASHILETLESGLKTLVWSLVWEKPVALSGSGRGDREQREMNVPFNSQIGI